MLESGANTLAELKRRWQTIPLYLIDRAFCSHPHLGHIGDLGQFILEREIQAIKSGVERRLILYGTPVISEILDNVIDENEGIGFNVRAMAGRQDLGDVFVFPVPHVPGEDSYGIRFMANDTLVFSPEPKKIVHLGDCNSRVQTLLPEEINDPSVLIIEATSAFPGTTHLDFSQAAYVATQLNARETIFNDVGYYYRQTVFDGCRRHNEKAYKAASPRGFGRPGRWNRFDLARIGNSYIAV